MSFDALKSQTSLVLELMIDIDCFHLWITHISSRKDRENIFLYRNIMKIIYLAY